MNTDCDCELRRLAKVYGALCMYRDKLSTVQSLETCIIEEADTLISQLESELSGCQPSDMSCLWDWGDLEKLDIFGDGRDLQPRPDFEIAVAETTSLGSNDPWSSQNFLLNLNLLKNTMTEANETRVRALVDAFFLRVTAMLPTGKHLVIHTEQNPPPTTVSLTGISAQTSSGFMDYSAIVTNGLMTKMLMGCSWDEVKRCLPTGVNGFFTLAGKFTVIVDCIPQAIGKMYTMGKYLGRKIIRGALTNGYQWIFLILKMNDDSIGASYRESAIIKVSRSVSDDHGQVMDRTIGANIIAAILLHWTQNSFSDLDGNDLLVEQT